MFIIEREKIKCILETKEVFPKFFVMKRDPSLRWIKRF
jgi:hypothetical protein